MVFLNLEEITGHRESGQRKNSKHIYFKMFNLAKLSEAGKKIANINKASS